MTENRLALSLFFLFALSAAYLFSVNERGLDPDQGKSWWSLAFTRPPESRDLGFTIANHTKDRVFHYTVNSDQGVLATGELSIEPGQSIEYTPNLSTSFPISGRVTITVTHEAKDETIYRSL